MTEEKKEVTVIEKDEKTKGFELALRHASMLSKSTMVPEKHFQGQANIGNCMIAMELADRMGVSVFALMQNMYIVHGRPGLEGKFIAGLVNQKGVFNQLQYERIGSGKTDEGIDRPEKCRAWAVNKQTGEKVFGPWITWDMVCLNGWQKPKGSETSKWQLFPDLMFVYRSATHFARMHCPEVLMGMMLREEVEELPPPPPKLVMDETPPDGTDPYKIKDAPANTAAWTAANEVAKEIVGQVTGTKTDDADQAPLTDSPLPPWNNKSAIDCPRIKQKKFVQVCLKCDEKQECGAFGNYVNEHMPI